MLQLPLVIGLEEHNADQPDDRAFIREDPNHVSLPVRLLTQAWRQWAETRAAEGNTAAGSSAQAVLPRRMGPSSADQAAEIPPTAPGTRLSARKRNISKQAAVVFGQATDRR
jgi:transposase